MASLSFKGRSFQESLEVFWLVPSAKGGKPHATNANEGRKGLAIDRSPVSLTLRYRLPSDRKERLAASTHSREQKSERGSLSRYRFLHCSHVCRNASGWNTSTSVIEDPHSAQSKNEAHHIVCKWS